MVVLLIFFAFFLWLLFVIGSGQQTKIIVVVVLRILLFVSLVFFVLWLFVVGSDQHKSRLIHSCAVNQLEAMTAACSTSNASKSSSAAGTAPHKYFRKTEKNIACEQPKLGVKSIFKNTVVLVEASISQTLLVQIV